MVSVHLLNDHTTDTSTANSVETNKRCNQNPNSCNKSRQTTVHESLKPFHISSYKGRNVFAIPYLATWKFKTENKGNTGTYCHFDNWCQTEVLYPTYIYSNLDIWTIPKSYDWYYIRIQSRIKSHIYIYFIHGESIPWGKQKPFPWGKHTLKNNVTQFKNTYPLSTSLRFI